MGCLWLIAQLEHLADVGPSRADAHPLIAASANVIVRIDTWLHHQVSEGLGHLLVALRVGERLREVDRLSVTFALPCGASHERGV